MYLFVTQRQQFAEGLVDQIELACLEKDHAHCGLLVELLDLLDGLVLVDLGEGGLQVVDLLLHQLLDGYVLLHEVL